MAEIRNLERLVLKLQTKAAKARADDKASVVVGYTQSYALFVHENVEMKWQGLPRRSPAKGVYWGPRGQAKFLEQPARENQDVYAKLVVDALVKGATMAQALLIAGLRLQRDSQLIVPVDTGALKNSAFTRLEKK